MPTKKGRKCLFILSYANPLTISNFLNQVMKILAPVRLHKRVQWLTKCVVPTHPRIAITLCALVWTKAEKWAVNNSVPQSSADATQCKCRAENWKEIDIWLLYATHKVYMKREDVFVRSLLCLEFTTSTQPLVEGKSRYRHFQIAETFL